MQQRIGTGALLVQMDVEPEWEEEFNRWYNEEHVPDLLKIPGFLGARRFVAVEGQPKYLALYEVESADVLSSEPYTHLRSNRSEWTLRILDHVKMNRVVYRQVFPAQGAYTG